jgi:hypothetical protein
VLLGLMISALSLSGLSAGFFGIQMWHGTIRRDQARLGPFWTHRAGQSLQTAALGASAPTAALFESSYGDASFGMARRGTASRGMVGLLAAELGDTSPAALHY